MEETVKKQEQEPVTVTEPETEKKQEPVIETVTNPKPTRECSKLQDITSVWLGKNSVMLKQKKKERLLKELQDQQALHNQHDVATIKELIKEEEPVQDQTAIYICLGLVAIIGFGAYSLYSRKADIQPIKAVETVKSRIVNME